MKITFFAGLYRGYRSLVSARFSFESIDIQGRTRNHS